MIRRLQVMTALLTLLMAGSASAQRYHRNYGSMVGGDSYVSELDREKAARTAKKEAERADTKERMRQRSEDQAAYRWAKKEEASSYTPAAPEQSSLVITNLRPALTAEKICDGLVERERREQALASAPTAAPKEGYRVVFVGDEAFYFRAGEFFRKEGEAMMPVAAPAGAMVASLGTETPAEEVTIGGKTFFKAGGNFFDRVLLQGRPVFRTVVPPPQ